MPNGPSTYPKNLAKPEVLLPLPALSSKFASSAEKPADLMTSIKTCNRTPQSHTLLKNSLYHHITNLTYPQNKILIDRLTQDFPKLGEHAVFWRTLTALRLYQGQLLRTHHEDTTTYQLMTDPLTFGIPDDHQGSLEWLIEAKDPVAVTILLLHGANPGASISMMRKDLPLNHAYYLYSKETNEEEKSKLETIMAVLCVFYRGSNNPLQDQDLQEHPDLIAFLESAKFKEKVSEVQSFINELEQEQTFRLACQTDPTIIFGKMALAKLLEILTNKSHQLSTENLPKFLGITFNVDFIKKHIHVWLPQYMNHYKLTEQDQAYLRETGKISALIHMSIEENNYLLTITLIKISRELKIELAIDERNAFITTTLTTYKKHLQSNTKEKTIRGETLEDFPIVKLNIPKDASAEALQHHQQTLELQAEVVSAKDQWVSTRSKILDLNDQRASEQEIAETREDFVIAKDTLEAIYQRYRTHILSKESEQSFLIALSPDELALKFLTLFCDTLQPIIHLSAEHWKLLRDPSLADTLLLKDCRQHRSQNTVVGDFKGKLDISHYKTYKNFQTDTQIPEEFKTLLAAVNGLTANAFIHKMHQLIQGKFLTNTQTISLALELFKEVMIAQGIAAMMTDPAFDDEAELIQTLKLAFHLWPGIVDAKLSDYNEHFIHLTLSGTRLGLAESLVRLGCNIFLADERGRLPHHILLQLGNLSMNNSVPIQGRLQALKSLCNMNQTPARTDNYSQRYRSYYLKKLKEKYPSRVLLINYLDEKKTNIAQIYTNFIQEISKPVKKALSVDSAKLKEKLIETFPDQDAQTIKELDLPVFDDMDKFLLRLKEIKIWSELNNFVSELPLFTDADIRKFKANNTELFIEPSLPTAQDLTALEELTNQYRVKIYIEGKEHIFYIDEYFTVQDIFNFLQNQIPSLKTLNDLSQRLGMLLEPELKIECLTRIEITLENEQIIRGQLIAKDPISPVETKKDAANKTPPEKRGFFDRLFSGTQPSSPSAATTAAAASASTPGKNGAFGGKK